VSLLIRWLVSTVSLLLVAFLLPGFHVSGVLSAFLAALIIGLVNSTVGIVFKILTLPLTLLTLGLFWLIANALMLELAAALAPGFSIDGFGWAFVGSILLSLVNLLLRGLFASSERREQ
jgi:putative membrane protein